MVAVVRRRRRSSGASLGSAVSAEMTIQPAEARVSVIGGVKAGRVSGGKMRSTVRAVRSTVVREVSERERVMVMSRAVAEVEAAAGCSWDWSQAVRVKRHWLASSQWHPSLTLRVLRGALPGKPG